MKVANPYLNFERNAKEAFDFYRSIFGGEFEAVIYMRDMPGADQLPEAAHDRIAHIALPIGSGNLLMASDTLDSSNRRIAVGNNVYIHLETDSADEAERVFAGLSANGEVEMPLERTFWAEKFGACGDRFGVRWMVSFQGDVEFDAG